MPMPTPQCDNEDLVDERFAHVSNGEEQQYKAAMFAREGTIAPICAVWPCDLSTPPGSGLISVSLTFHGYVGNQSITPEQNSWACAVKPAFHCPWRGTHPLKKDVGPKPAIRLPLHAPSVSSSYQQLSKQARNCISILVTYALRAHAPWLLHNCETDQSQAALSTRIHVSMLAARHKVRSCVNLGTSSTSNCESHIE